MRVDYRIVVGGVTLGLLAACGGQETVSLESFSDSASYAVGMSFGSNLVPARDSVDVALVTRGLADIMDESARIPVGDAQQILQRFSVQLQQAAAAEQAANLESARAAGAAYLAENGSREGVVTTQSGLQYEVLTEGEGPKPTAADRVTVHYRGSLTDGTEFESTFGGSPTTFAVNGVIAGWTEGLQLMSVGSRYRFVIPSDMAYGPMGSGRAIGPNQTLIFEVELVAIAP